MINKITIEKEIIICNNCLCECRNPYYFGMLEIDEYKTGRIISTLKYTSFNGEMHLCSQCFDKFQNDCNKQIKEFMDSLINSWLYACKNK